MKDFSFIVFCAFRYALGRMTYVPGMVAEFIVANINYIWTKDIKLMIKEITEAEKKNRLGMDFDARMWCKLRDFLETELEKRNAD